MDTFRVWRTHPITSDAFLGRSTRFGFACRTIEAAEEIICNAQYVFAILDASYAGLNHPEDINVESIPNSRAPMCRTKTVPELLEQLDARVRPGIPDSEFLKLFVRCECGLVVTRRAFGEHKCRAAIIDLTEDA